MFKKMKSIGQRVCCLASDKRVHYLLVKLVLLFTPVLIGLGYVEHVLSKVAVSYSQKRHELKHQLNQIQVLVLGSSNAYYGINPHLFSYKGFNFAYRAQWPYYDFKLVQKYVDKMPNLKIVIYPVIYYTMGTRVTEMLDDWRVFFYEQYYHISPPLISGGFINIYKPFDARHFSKIAMFGERTKDYLLNGTYNPTDGEPAEDNTGWFDSGEKPCDVSLGIGLSGATAHNEMVNVKMYAENLHYVQKLADILAKKNIKLVIIELPENPLYTDHLDPKKYAAMEQAVHEFVAKNHLQYFNYQHDKRFTLDDYTDMPDHLNAIGAARVSKMINEDIVIPTMEAITGKPTTFG